jgi:hypothetical protein
VRDKVHRGHIYVLSSFWLIVLSSSSSSSSSFPLRPLSRVASDYFSDSVVCIEILRPLRPLREIKIRVFLFSRKDRREHKVLFTFRIPRLRWSGRKLRYDKSAQRVLSTPSPLRGTPACLRGRKWVMALVSCNYSLPHREGWGGS